MSCIVSALYLVLDLFLLLLFEKFNQSLNALAELRIETKILILGEGD